MDDKKIIINYPTYVVMTQTKGCGSCECCASEKDLPEGQWFHNFNEAEKYYQDCCRNINILSVSFFIELNSHNKEIDEFRSTPDPVYS